MLLASALLILALYLLKYAFARRRFLAKLKDYKVVKGLPLIGVALDFVDPLNSMKNGLKYLNQYGHNFIVLIGPKITLAATEPYLVECILGSNKLIEKGEDYRYFERWFGSGLLTSGGSKWRSHRKIITPSFHYKILEDFVDVFDKSGRILVKKLKNEVGNDSVDIFQYVTLCTLDIICETAMGTQIDAQNHPQSDYVKSVKEMCDVIYARVFSPILRFDLLYYFSSMYKLEKKALKVIHGHTNSVIKQRKQALLNNSERNENFNEFGVKSKNSFLDALLKCNINGVPLTDEEIREEVDTFMFEGHDTTAVSISFTLYLLGKHLDVQEKVYEEIKSLLGEDLDKPTTYEVLQQMKYLEMVIKESLRLFPSVAGFSRVLSEDTIFNGTILPKDLEVVLLPRLLHLNPDIYPYPERFDPERFSFENSTKRHPYAYVPFSAGPRNCIGQKFAMLELKSTISKVLRCFRILPAIPDHEVLLISKVTLQSATGIKIRLQPRI